MITITIPTPMEAIQGVKVRREIRKELDENLKSLRRERGLARVRWAATRFADNELKAEVDALDELISLAEKALSTL